MIATILDADTLGMLGIANRLPSDEKARTLASVAERVMQIKAGVNRYPQLDETLQLAFKDNLRTRIDFSKVSEPLIIERYSPDAGCWLFVMQWPQEHDGKAWTVEQVINKLRECDTRQWNTPEDYLRHKRDVAARVRAENMRRAQDRLLNVIDKMGSRRVKNFIDVERAIVSGERITAHGDDLRRFERLNASSVKHEGKVYHALKRGVELASKLGIQVVGVDDQYEPVYTDAGGEVLKPTGAINPGHHPKVHKRGEPA